MLRRYFGSDGPGRIFLLSLIVTFVVLVATGIIASLSAAVTVLILGIMEVALSFDNAIINARVLDRMNPFWQKMFLTIGVLIAVFGMRLLLPVIIVSVTAHLSFGDVVGMALHHPASYAEHLQAAHPAISAFGGVFLLMIFLDWVFEERDIMWLKWLEQPLYRIGKLDQLSVIISVAALVAVAIAWGDGHQAQILIAGLLGLASYLAVNAAGGVIGEGPAGVVTLGLGGFLYLEVIDASFSFDGVISAFAITQKVLLIAAGLGIGAMFVRSLTVFLVREKALTKYCYLEHGAYWAIGGLAIVLFLSQKYHIGEAYTGSGAVVLILGSLYWSKRSGVVETISHQEDETPPPPIERPEIPERMLEHYGQ